MYKIFLLCMITISHSSQLSRRTYESNYPDITDLFPSFKEPNNKTDIDYREKTYNITIDLEKVDLVKLHNNVLNGLGNRVLEEDGLTGKNSRRTPLVYWYDYGGNIFKTASQIQCRRKLCDLVLQLAYMARAKVVQLESNENFNTKDIAFRMGFIAKRMDVLLANMGQLYTAMYRNNMVFSNSHKHVTMHHRSVRYSIDLNYYYWILLRLDGKYREVVGDPLSPKNHNPKAGVSAEDVIKV